MRISSNTIFANNVTLLNQQQTQLAQTQQQVASGMQLTNASVNPVAYTQAMEVTQSTAINTQQSASGTAALNSVSLEESTLQGVTSLLQNVRTTALSAGNGSLNASDRATLATALSGQLQQLMGLANSTDSTGSYMFSGFQSQTTPFVSTPAGVSYFGDNGQSTMQVAGGRQIAVNDSGADVFMRIKNGNGTFVAQADTANTGSGTIAAGTVANPAALTGQNYSISFGAGGTSYSVLNTTTGVAVAGQTAQPYVSGQAISFDGMQLSIQGTPAAGDSFSVAPSTNQSVFTTISNLVTALNSPVTGASLTNSLNSGLGNIDNALNNVLNTQTSLGLRINEINALQATSASTGLQLQQTLSTLQDTNVTLAISNLTMQQTILQAAQKSFVQVANLSMFTYM
ncbi:MAG: flagellar hook-associated protein FlgL [Proteobacteria bacterium]|nr:flagellar hook-associated protein FlgL [Pseudomonadota bacterium]